MSFLILARDFGLFEYFSSVINFKPFLWTLVTTVLNSQLCKQGSSGNINLQLCNKHCHLNPLLKCSKLLV